MLQCGLWKNEKFSLTKKIFRQINSLVTYLVTVWKSILKRYHAEKISVKPKHKIMLILLLQMHTFLPFGGKSGSNGLN